MKTALITSLVVNVIFIGTLVYIRMSLAPMPEPTPPAVKYIFVTNITSVAEPPGS